MSLSVASVTAIGYIVAIGPAPPANATPCNAPEANVDPRPAGDARASAGRPTADRAQACPYE